MRIGGATYEDCVKYESEAYERQCKFLYDGKPDLEQLCIKSGVCNSCKNFPNAPQNCLPWPNYEDQPFKLWVNQITFAKN